MQKTIFYLAIFALLTGCKEGWTEEYKQQYLAACKDSPNTTGLSVSQKEAYCACSMDEVMKRYATIEDAVVNKDSLAMNAALLRCRESAAR